MAKDPALLWYPGDWLAGTMTMNRLQKGAYMDLLVAQFNNGRLSLLDIQTILGSDFEQWDLKLKSKFKEENGLFYNERLDLEKNKRSKFTQSRRDNLTGKELLTTKDRQDVFWISISVFLKEFGEASCIDFFNYWSEPNNSGTKLRFEMQTTWHLHRRLKRWVSNDFNKTSKAVDPARMVR